MRRMLVAVSLLDGANLADGSSDASRISFTVVADVIVGFEWS